MDPPRQLKASLQTLTGLDLPLNEYFGIRLEFGDNEGNTTLRRYVPDIQLQTSFAFQYEGEPEINFLVINKDECIIASAYHSLNKVLEAKEVTEIVELSPSGKLKVHFSFSEAPANPPQWLTFQLHSLKDLQAKDVMGKIDPYCILKLDDVEFGRTKVAKDGGPNVFFDNEVQNVPYHSQHILSIEVYDKDRIGKDDPIGETVLDLWDLLKSHEKPNIDGVLPISAVQSGGVGAEVGKAHIALNFWDNTDERDRQLTSWHFGSPDTVDITSGPARGSSSSSSSSSSLSSGGTPAARSTQARSKSSSSETRLNPEEEEAVINEIKRLADQAAKDATKARSAAELAARTAELSPDSPEVRDHAARGAEAAARAAEAASRARVLADGVHPPLTAASLDRLRKPLEQAAGDAAQDKNDAINAAKNACAVSADADALKARESAQRAHQYHSETYDIACAHPDIPSLMQPLKDADHAAKDSAEAAGLARAHADDCDRASTLEAALDEAAAVRRAAHQAREKEEKAEQAYKEARRLARKEEKRRQKRLLKQQALEEQKRHEEAEARERARQAEHLQDLERRRIMISPTDVTENRLYQGVTGYSYHNAVKESDVIHSARKGPSGAFVCCSSPTGTRGRLDSEESLHPTIPKHELRGLKGHVAGSVDLSRDAQEAAELNAVMGHKQVLLEDDGILEAMGNVKRPWCWCFGCGCMKCCGEC